MGLSDVNVACIIGIFYLEHAKVIWGPSVYFSEKRGITQKWLILRVKQMKIWTSGVYVVCILVLFNLEHGKVILGSFGALCTKLVHNLKTAHLKSERDENLGLGGVLVSCILVFLTLNMSRPFTGHLVH